MFPATPSRALVTGLLATLTVATACRKAEPAAGPATAEKTAAAPTSTTGKTPAAPVPVPEPVRKLLGRWLRLDGGYVLELRTAGASGALDAGYFNPKSINVSRAIWMQGAAGLQVVVELNDVGYPGATYVLSHDAQTDRLVGKYNQPAMQQSFEIEFVRQPKP